eukprot:TRINITY_DN15565_c0_g1_i7.p1 TRINITY_DN15565_c0_g1~~TRINITY_DN15565_c0_g1_i7.p1  ORF type:complete len:228 (+),score=-28.28 TRINITY_DN15565_c0_g1_i7:112-795(+)
MFSPSPQKISRIDIHSNCSTTKPQHFNIQHLLSQTSFQLHQLKYKQHLKLDQAWNLLYINLIFIQQKYSTYNTNNLYININIYDTSSQFIFRNVLNFLDEYRINQQHKKLLLYTLAFSRHLQIHTYGSMYYLFFRIYIRGQYGKIVLPLIPPPFNLTQSPYTFPFYPTKTNSIRLWSFQPRFRITQRSCHVTSRKPHVLHQHNRPNVNCLLKLPLFESKEVDCNKSI